MTRTSVASSRIDTVSIVLGDRLPLVVDRRHLVEDLLLELGEIVRSSAAPSPPRCSRRSRRRRRLAVLRRHRADRVRDRAGAALAAEERAEHGAGARRSARSPGATSSACRAPRPGAARARARSASRSFFASRRFVSFAVSASAFAWPASSQRARNASSRLAGAGGQLELLVAEDLERAVRDEPRLHVLAGLGEELRLADRRGRQHVGGAGGRVGAEVAVVEVDDRLGIEVEAAVERPVERLELLLLVDARRRCRRSAATRAWR